MVVSVNTNASALIALQNLNQTSRELFQVQNRISSGLKVASAKDNASIFAIAQNLRADLGGLESVKQSLDRGVSTVDVALNAATAISDLLVEMKAKAVSASDLSLDTDSRTALKNDFDALRNQIQTIVDNAAFNGSNLLAASSAGAAVTAIVSADGKSTVTVAAQDLSLATSSLLGITAASTFTTATTAATLVTALDAALTAVNKSLATLGTGSKSLETLRTFTDKLSDSIEVGIGNLVDADLARESARLQSLQVKQQLGATALSIANASPNIILSLFG